MAKEEMNKELTILKLKDSVLSGSRDPAEAVAAARIWALMTGQGRVPGLPPSVEAVPTRRPISALPVIGSDPLALGRWQARARQRSTVLP